MKNIKLLSDMNMNKLPCPTFFRFCFFKWMFLVAALAIYLPSLLHSQIDSVQHLNYFEEIQKQTENHIHHLQSIGLGERAKGIKVIPFEYNDEDLKNIHLDIFSKRTAIPQEVINFDSNLKNTLITTDAKVDSNKPEDLKKILDIRLYPVLKDHIRKHNVDVFLGTRNEMAAYYKSKNMTILFEFIIPSSATYYLAVSNTGDFKCIMAGLVSYENIIAQMLTLKLAGINIQEIQIIGDPNHFKEIVHNDINNIEKMIPELSTGTNVLIVAGCGLEDTVKEIVQGEFQQKLGKEHSFKGDIVSFTYLPFVQKEKNISGIISLHLNYGEITEEIVSGLLEKCNCKFVFTGGAGGYISQNSSEKKPEIGSRVNINKCLNEKGEMVFIDNTENLNSNTASNFSSTHLQISSIFLETYQWLENAKLRGSSVDVETFYIIRAIMKYNAGFHSNKIKADCGYFVSDYVGEEPLREYSKVYQNYPKVLTNFLKSIID